MANQPETSTWETGIYQLETTDPVEGGVGGVSNEPLRQLGNRTKFLKDEIARIDGYGYKFKDVVVYTGGTTALAAADVGKLYVLNSTTTSPGGNKITLPPSADVADGTHIAVLFKDNLTFTIQPAGSDTVDGGNRRLENKGDFAIFVKKGTAWYVTSEIIANRSVAAGTVIAYAANSIPSGYLKANGAAVSRTVYADLFAVIGTTFGVGDGSTTFNLPDLRGEFIRGFDDGRGADSGRVFGSTQAEGVNTAGVQLREASTTWAASGAAFGSSVAYFENSNIAAYGSNMALMGGWETRPRNIALLYLIKF